MDFESPGLGSTLNFHLGGWAAAQPVSEGNGTLYLPPMTPPLFRRFGGIIESIGVKSTQWFIVWLVKTAQI
jgi:hypothetical protein